MVGTGLEVGKGVRVGDGGAKVLVGIWIGSAAIAEGNSAGSFERTSVVGLRTTAGASDSPAQPTNINAIKTKIGRWLCPRVWFIAPLLKPVLVKVYNHDELTKVIYLLLWSISDYSQIHPPYCSKYFV